ncbi:MAG: RnfABCDGE type electron transport complex subunit D [Candidatus Omnitrophica bacterium]|nr:RnfABCDGE type electron transport complex subunit D [Candidatus Omnitrophota bacterium]
MVPEQKERFIVGPSPHLLSPKTTSFIMWAVFISLLPSGIAGVIIFGWSALKVILLSIASCAFTEAIIQKLMHKKITLYDGSACLTGLLLGYNLSNCVPFWIPLVGGFFAIAVAKQAFGGLGKNIFNPALSARVFLLVCWPSYMTKFTLPFQPDTITSATPLMALKKIDYLKSVPEYNYLELFLGLRPGCIGEVCVLALLLGAGYLLFKKYISWQAPLGFLFSLGLLSWIFDKNGYFKGDILFSLLSGGVILGAFFMATDYVTTPITKKGQLLFGLGCGLITFIIRRFTFSPEGVSFSILIMNAFTPLIDRYVKPKVYGKK